MTVPIYGDDMITLLHSTAEELAELEFRFGTTQTAVVDDLIEDSCWSGEPSLEPYLGGKGSAEQRLQALRAALAADDKNSADKSTEWQVSMSQASKLAELGEECPICGGTGQWPGLQGFVACKPCGGAGSKVPTSTIPNSIPN